MFVRYFFFFVSFLLANEKANNNRTYPLVNPKNVQIPFESYNFEQFDNQNSIFNPITGEINQKKVEKLQKELLNKKNKEIKHKAHKEKYTESSFRRSNIIFFMTLPFSAVFSYFIGYQFNLQKKPAGALVIFTSSVGLSFLNVYYDKKSPKHSFESSFKQKPSSSFFFQIASKRF